MSNVIKPVFGAAKDVVKGVAKDVGQSAHKALGGGFRDAAVAKGITNQRTLRGIKDPRSFLKETKPKAKPSIFRTPGDPLPVATKGSRKLEINKLQDEKKKAIVKTIGYGAGGVYAAGKIKDKITGADKPQYY